MSKHSRLLALLALAVPFSTWAQVPIIEGGSGYPPSGYGATGAAYAGGAAAAAPTSAQGELFLQLQQLQEEVARLRGTLEEQQYEIQRLKQESLERYQDLDSRLSAAPQSPAPAPVAPADGAANAAPVQAPAASAAPGDPAKEKLFYDAAFDLIKAKDFAKADQAFSAFLRKYPGSQYAGNAQYWLGEVKLAQGDLQGAGRAFAQVSQSYPQHQKVADSLYKLADVEQRLGNAAKAKGILQQVVAQYPGTSAAQLAQRDLARLP
jgi:tol-pal system protein YbgF